MNPLNTEQVIIYFNEYRFPFTLLIVIAIWILKLWIVDVIRGDTNFLTENQRKWMARTKNISFFTLVFVVFFLWRSEINEFALSLTAIAVAVVVASKEIILCFTGYIQRASSQSFQIGEWIEVGQLSGEVIDHNLMATTIQEIDIKYKTYVYTGKTVTLPNSLFFTTPVKNLNFMKRYVYHEFHITLKDSVNMFPHLPKLQLAIDGHCADFFDVATRYNQIIERRAGVDLPGAEPHLMLSTTEFADQQLHIRLFCPTERATELEHAIRQDTMNLYYRLLSDSKSSS